MDAPPATVRHQAFTLLQTQRYSKRRHNRARDVFLDGEHGAAHAVIDLDAALKRNEK